LDDRTFAIELLKAGGWPAALLCLAWMLRDELKSLVSGLGQLAGKVTFAEAFGVKLGVATAVQQIDELSGKLAAAKDQGAAENPNKDVLLELERLRAQLLATGRFAGKWGDERATHRVDDERQTRLSDLLERISGARPSLGQKAILRDFANTIGVQEILGMPLAKVTEAMSNLASKVAAGGGAGLLNAGALTGLRGAGLLDKANRATPLGVAQLVVCAAEMAS
jgi:hypothetical protein